MKATMIGTAMLPMINLECLAKKPGGVGPGGVGPGGVGPGGVGPGVGG
ncbi:hypothetical protein [Streptomyces sp. NRRL F-5123]|nr:hypothetical protein [Streptomyces sp. NRRL F-5123]